MKRYFENEPNIYRAKEPCLSSPSLCVFVCVCVYSRARVIRSFDDD